MKLFPKNIYHYKKPNNETGICVYVCDTDNSNEIIVGCIEDVDPLNNDYIKMSNGLNKVLYLDRYKTLKIESITSPLFVKKQHVSISSKEFQLLTTNIYKLLLLKYENQVNDTAFDNFDNDSLVDIGMPEEIIKLLTWNTKKIGLKFKEEFPAIVLGNLIAGTIITLLTAFLSAYVDLIIYALLAISIIMLIILIIKIVITPEKQEDNN